MFNVPLFLTLSRLFAAVILFPPLFLLCPWETSFPWACFVSFVFFLVGMTDFVDGWYARAYKQETVLGRVLDPIADKVYIMAALMLLASAGRIDFILVMLLIGREFLVSGIREAAPEFGCSVPVSWWGKWKMAVQLVMCAYLIVDPIYYGCDCLPTRFLGIFLICSALFLSFISAWFYVRRFFSKKFSCNNCSR